MRTVKATIIRLSIPLLALWVSASSTAAQAPDPHQLLGELSRLSARKPFLTDSPDVYLEPDSLGRFFSVPIYKKLRGNAYFGYEYDEGFLFQSKVVQIEVLKDLTPGRACQTTYPIALHNAFKASGIEVQKAAPHQIGVCIVGIEARETPQTLPGVMVEAYFRNSVLQKSFFIRYGTGHRRGLPHAVRLSAETLIAQLVSRTKNNDNAQR